MTMIGRRSRLSRAALPAIAFLGVWIIHYAWLHFFPERDSQQEQWITLETDTLVRSSWQSYLDGQSYYLSFAYALSISFAVVAIRKYREQQFCAAKNLAIGGVTLSGFLALTGCFLIGCCGSPMLAVYMNLFGAKFLPLAKPIIAGVSVLSVGGAWVWMEWRERRFSSVTIVGSLCVTTTGCGCDDQKSNKDNLG